MMPTNAEVIGSGKQHFTRLARVATLAIGGLAAASLGCGSDPEFPETPQDAAPPPVVTTPPPPASTPAPPVQPICDAVQSAAFASIFAGRAPTEAPRMELEGGVVCGVAQEGGVVQSTTYVLQPGYCYTVLGNGLPNVSELDLMFQIDLTAAGVPPALAALAAAPLAVDSDTGAMAAIGAKQNCYKWAWPIPGAVKLTLKSRTGSGPVGAQVYKKKQAF